MTDDTGSNRLTAAHFNVNRARRDACPPGLRLAMNQLTTCRWSFEEDAIAYRDAGYEAVGIARSKLVVFGEERGADCLLEHGLAASSVSWAGGFTGADGQSLADSMADAQDALRAAALLRASCLVAMTGPRASYTYNHARRIVAEALNELADEAQRSRVTLAVQPLCAPFGRKWTFLNTLDETLEFLDRCAHPNIKMVFNAAHLWSERELLERIPQIASRVALVQLSDAEGPLRSEDDCCVPGDGEIPLAEMIASFTEAGYGGFFEINLWSEEIWNSDYAELLSTCFGRCCALPTAER